MNFILFQACIETKLPREEVTAEALSILDEMAHNQRMGAIRGFSYALIKIFKSLYRRIYVNVEGIQKVKRSVILLNIFCFYEI